MKQLSNLRFYKKLGGDPINNDQQQIKSLIAEMINNNELLPSANNLVVSTLWTPIFFLSKKAQRIFCILFMSCELTRLTPNNDHHKHTLYGIQYPRC